MIRSLPLIVKERKPLLHARGLPLSYQDYKECAYSAYGRWVSKECFVMTSGESFTIRAGHLPGMLGMPLSLLGGDGVWMDAAAIIVDNHTLPMQ